MCSHEPFFKIQQIGSCEWAYTVVRSTARLHDVICCAGISEGNAMLSTIILIQLFIVFLKIMIFG